jgi:hypothetical protein
MPRPKADGADPEVAKLVLGVPGLQAQVPVRRSLLSRLGRVFRRSNPELPFRVASGLAYVHVPEDDDGTIDVYVTVVNLSRHTASIEQVHLHGCQANGNNLSVMAPIFRPPDNPIPPQELLEFSFRIPIQAAAIRTLLRVVQPTYNSRSSPKVQLVVEGTLMVRMPKRLIPVRFTSSIRTPDLNFNCPSAAK